jgi:hypothetical protein
MPVINVPLFQEYYSSIIEFPTVLPEPKPIYGDVLASDGKGGTHYIPGNETLRLVSAMLSTISTYSMTVFGPNTFTSQGSSIFLGPVYYNKIEINTAQDVPIAIGKNAGQINQAPNAIAIGSYAGQTSQYDSTIVLNATGIPLNTLNTAGTYIAPIRYDSTSLSTSLNTSLSAFLSTFLSTSLSTDIRFPVYWNSITSEIVQGPFFIDKPQLLFSAESITVNGTMISDSISTISSSVNYMNNTVYTPYTLISDITTGYSEVMDAYITNTDNIHLYSIQGKTYVPNQIVSTISTILIDTSL